MNTTIRPAGGLCLPDKCRVTLLALGDVGSTLLISDTPGRRDPLHRHL